MRIHLTLAATLLIAVTIPANAADKPACDLINVQEASAILGVSAKAGPAITPMACSFNAVAGQAALMVMVPPASGADPADQVKPLIMVNNMDRSHPPAELVSGVGNQALFLFAANGDFTLMAFTKTRTLQIVVQHGSGPTTPARRQAMIDEMKRMISRL